VSPASGADYDVVVIGAGAAGLAAALTARAAGATVLVAEASTAAGGAMGVAGGSVLGAGTWLQREAGYEDDADDLFAYYMTYNQWRLEPSITRAFCDGSGSTIAWLRDLGVGFRRDDLFRSGPERVPRTHRAVGGGAAMARTLATALGRAGADLALGSRVSRITAGDGCRFLVEAADDGVSSLAVVIATGGFAANLDLVRQHFPDARMCGDWLFSPSLATCVGDGLRMASTLGASTAGTNQGELNLSPGFTDDLEPFRPGWLVLVDETGRRFVNELAPTAVMRGLLRYRGGRCWALLDERCRSAARGPDDASWGRGSWTADSLQAQAAAGRVRTAGTIEQLATEIGVPRSQLAATVDTYNEDCHQGRDTRFFKAASVMRPLEEPPFYAAEVRASAVVATGFGVRIDARTRVLASSGSVIEGLYAAGEVAGDVYGEQHLGSGLCLGTALTFGRIAGAEASAHAAAAAGR
jgi:fumarate reductase flavoprotein subunit